MHEIRYPSVYLRLLYMTCSLRRAGKNLRFFFKVFRFLGFLGFLGFNVYAQSHSEHWTQEYDHLKSYTRRLTHALIC